MQSILTRSCRSCFKSANELSIASRYVVVHFSINSKLGSSDSDTNKNDPTGTTREGADQINPERPSNSKNEVNFNIDEMVLNSSGTVNVTEEESFYDNEEDYFSDDEIVSQVLNVAVEFVPQYGWTTKSIDEAIKALDLSPSASGMFKRGAVELVLHFLEESNNILSEHLAEEVKKGEITSPSKFIEYAIQTRLKMIIPYIDSWPQAMILLASPMAVTDCLEQGMNMVDEMWYHAGDMSTDVSWYTKRALLAGLYTATELYMLQDKSKDFNDTWEFLHRRMLDSKSLDMTKKSLQYAADDFYALGCAGITTVQNILGLNKRSR